MIRLRSDDSLRAPTSIRRDLTQAKKECQFFIVVVSCHIAVESNAYRYIDHFRRSRMHCGIVVS